MIPLRTEMDLIRASCLVVLLACAEFQGDGARILGIFPSPSFSHQLVFQTIMKALSARGHHVTVISTDPLKEPIGNYTDVDLSFMYDYVRGKLNFSDCQGITAFGTVLRFSLHVGIVCNMQLGSPAIQDFIRCHPSTNTSFDLVFMEMSRYQCYYGLIHHVGSPPVIGIRSVGTTSATLAAVGSPNNPAYFPDYYLPYTGHMTFFQRLHNTAIYVWNSVLWHALLMPMNEVAMRYHFGRGPPSVWEAEKNVSLVMVNSHWSQSYPLPLLPAVIQLGNIHIQEKPKQLPQDLQEFLDGAAKGAVYFSLGSNVRSETMSPEKRRVFLSAFADVPQRVLWKWEANDTSDVPDNVKLAKWLPQQDVLAHPNVRLFITQGGLQSFQEATYYAVPLIGIPFIADQQHNVRKMVDAGVGLQLDYATLSKDGLVTATRKVLHDPTFRENMLKFSTVAKDRPDKPLDSAVWWAEYVLRHNGARHLRSAALDLTWYQYFLLDVMATALFVLLLASYLTYVIVRWTFHRLVGRCSSAARHDVNENCVVAKKFD
ncbi:UDP-glucuronosyltransferase 2C1-like isoform X3 [Zootermopsis nevadensis]|uniref:UDP-glucuronosyltransferase 2C1-like isoform X3 n=1 Tax=Zootermopsis nevadensis TaxID=136037 RepID=UPI000B8E59DF|nr:UDP-glucuronosyltransferase 2C1-like isoform X3 [Zootermopsis nevadensis]